jgi:site-specific recombinase XerD
MAWQRNYSVLKTGERVRYSFVQRGGSDVYRVRFKGRLGKLVEFSTGCTRKVDAIGEAHRLILEEYGQIAPAAERMPWEEARLRLKEAMLADGKRPRTVSEYLKSLKHLAAMFPLAKGPADVSDRMAGDFKTKYANGRTVRKKNLKRGEQATAHKRRPQTLDSQLRMLKAAFTWFRKLGLVEANPFEKVGLPELDRHEVKYVRQEEVGEFFGWLDERYPDWAMPRLFFSVKAATACRLEDVCSLRSDQLQDGRLVFAADQTKNRSERYALLPADLYAALDAYKGKTYLWERYPPELIAANKAKGWPTHRQKAEFTPQRLYLWVLQLMGNYHRETGRTLRSHDFRRAAFTRAAEEDIHPKRAAAAFDVTAETMLRYYTATEKKKTSDEVLGDLAGKLLPKKKGEEKPPRRKEEEE